MVIGENCARYAVDGDAHIINGGALQAPSRDGQSLSTGRVAIDLADRVDLRVRLDIPAVIASEVAMVGGLAEEGITNSETDLGDSSANMLISGSRLQMADSVVREARFVVNKTLRIGTGAIELDVHDGVVRVQDGASVVRSLWVHQDRELLVEVHVAR